MTVFALKISENGQKPDLFLKDLVATIYLFIKQTTFTSSYSQNGFSLVTSRHVASITYIRLHEKNAKLM